MTPVALETYIRQRYNAVGDTFFAQAELFNHMWAAQMEIAQEAFCIKRTYTTTSVADQRAYDYPSTAFSIRRVEYDGQRIYPNDFIDDDGLTGNNPDDSITGRAEHYQEWGDQLYLRPVPSESALTIKVYSYDLPEQPTAIGTLDVPSRYHLMLADYVLYCMFAKDKNLAMANYHLQIWQTNKKNIIQIERMRRVGDEYRIVKDMDLVGDDSRFE